MLIFSLNGLVESLECSWIMVLLRALGVISYTLHIVYRVKDHLFRKPVRYLTAAIVNMQAGCIIPEHES